MKEFHLEDRLFVWFLKFVGCATVCLLLAMLAMLLRDAWPLLKDVGVHFFTRLEWDPVRSEFGAMAFIYGTLITSGFALVIATPLSVGVALFLTEVSRGRISYVAGFLIEMLAAVPSVVYGLWGIFVLAPLVRDYFQMPLIERYGEWTIFSGAPMGVGLFTASIILAIMVIPTITTICREVFSSISDNQREAALALGSTRWEMMQLSVLNSSKTGIMGAMVLGLGRAVGETMAVTMVIGNRNDISFSLLAAGQSMASIIANEYAEAQSTTHLAALAAIGFGLFFVSFAVNLFARFLILQMGPSR